MYSLAMIHWPSATDAQLELPLPRLVTIRVRGPTTEARASIPDLIGEGAPGDAGISSTETNPRLSGTGTNTAATHSTILIGLLPESASTERAASFHPELDAERKKLSKPVLINS